MMAGNFTVKAYHTGPGPGERWFGVFDENGNRIAGGWQDGNTFDGATAEKAAWRWINEQRMGKRFTQADLDNAIATERTRCAEMCRELKTVIPNIWHAVLDLAESCIKEGK